MHTPNKETQNRSLRRIIGDNWRLFLAAPILAGIALGFAACSKTPKNLTSLPAEQPHEQSSVAPAATEPPAAPRERILELRSTDAVAEPAARRSFMFSTAASPSRPRPAAAGDSIGEELWVIYRPNRSAPAAGDPFPGTGCLSATVDDAEVPLPLKHTSVNASVSACVASVDVIQQFENPYDQKIEAVYVFPLPENGAVNEFVMTIGPRKIRGIVRERKEAEKIYAQAKRQGRVASLMTQERPNIFKQSVANIEPGKRIDVEIRYYNTLSYSDGWYEFVFPMVVGPRFNPGGSKDGIGAVTKSPLAASRQPTQVHYLAPGERSGHDISLALTVSPGVPIEAYECKTHDIQVEDQKDRPWNTLSVKLSALDSVPNKDFVFRYRVAGEKIKSSLLTHMDDRGGFFTLMLYPPATLQSLERAPLELVFVLDCSGSMSGVPLQQAKSAIAWSLKNMKEDDTFQLINFSNDARSLGQRPLAATPANVQRALRHLESLQSEGGTMMIEGIKAALDFPHDPRRLRFVCFLTDGYIGNEYEILAAIQERLGASRIFSFGVGSSVNRFLMESMAKQGRGAVAYLGLQDDGAEVMQVFFDRISHPALTDVEIDWGSMDVSDVYPKRLPDLFVGKPVIVTGRLNSQGSGKRNIQLSGKTPNGRIDLPIFEPASAKPGQNEALPSVWARLKIADLLEHAAYDPPTSIRRQIRQTALDYSLLSPYTAFLAVDASRVTEGDVATTIPVAVPVPEGVRYETTVSR